MGGQLDHKARVGSACEGLGLGIWTSPFKPEETVEDFK